ncbi:YveK family protein [Candidatus Stoquefichus massiliensis]|uniref:YveK family protein n=1 Tax=Candidatus Stoquefichus massiliensis TaxID=1470350 RepID=UPI00048984B5|nr:Wzz/FepE/Etk N-terminal domain-containing protein [Candidatus Stoquefichus massiliensis]
MDIQSDQYEDEIEIDLKALFLHIRHYWYAVVIGALIGIFCAGIYLWKFEVPQYEASSMIYMRGSKTSVSLQDLQIGSELTNDYEIILKSRPILERVIKKLDLDMDYLSLGQHIQISNPTNTRILKMTVTTDDPIISKKIADTLANYGMDSIKEIDSKQPYLVENAIVNDHKVNTSPKMVFLMGLLIGCFISICALFIQFITNDRICSAEDIEKTLNIPVLAGVVESKVIQREKRNARKIASQKVFQ